MEKTISKNARKKMSKKNERAKEKAERTKRGGGLLHSRIQIN